MMPSVSVIIPAYDARETISWAVSSVLLQADVDIEVLLISDDHLDYRPVLQRAGVDDPRVRQLMTATPGSGPGQARTLGLDRAKGRFIATLDADDQYAPDRLAPLVALAAEHGAALDNTAMIAEDGTLLRTAWPVDTGHKPATADTILRPRLPFAPVFHRDLGGNGWPDLPFAEDVMFNLGLLDRAPSMQISLEPGYRYNHRSGSLSHSPDTPQRAEQAYLAILEALEHKTIPLAEEIAEAALRQFSEDLRSNATFADRLASGQCRDLSDFLMTAQRA